MCVCMAGSRKSSRGCYGRQQHEIWNEEGCSLIIGSKGQKFVAYGSHITYGAFIVFCFSVENLCIFDGSENACSFLLFDVFCLGVCFFRRLIVSFVSRGFHNSIVSV